MLLLLSLLYITILILFNISYTISFSNRIVLLKKYNINRTSILNNNNDKDYGKDYYMGMITNTDTDESDKKDNLTPNLKLAGIFIGILIGAVVAFIYANKDIPPPQF